MKLKLMMIDVGLKKSSASRYALGFYLIGNLISISVMFFLWQSVLRERPQIVFTGTVTYLILMQLLTVVFPKPSYDLSDDIRTGNIALLLLKPVSLLTHYFWEGVGYSLGKLIFTGIPDLILVSLFFPNWLSWHQLIFIGVAIVLGYVLYFQLEVMTGLFSFYTYSIWGISTFKAAVLLALSGNIFPVNFYPTLLRTVAEYLPFQYSFGAIGLLLTDYSLVDAFQTVTMQCGYIVVLFFVYRILLHFAIRRVVIQGG